MLRVVLTRGLPASGKSTWARQQLAEQPGAWKRVNKDDLRAMLDGGKWSGPNERFLLKVRDHVIAESLLAGKHVIVDDTNFEPKHETVIRTLVDGLRPGVMANVEVRDFTDVPLETCLARDTARANGVGADVILRMHHRYIAAAVPSYPHAGGLPLAVICDLDGTLALLNGRNPYDASTCEADAVSEPVRAVLISLQIERRATVLFVSGREEKDREPTLRFLSRAFPIWQEGVHFSLFMRAADDKRRDSIIKREIFDRAIAGQFNVMLAIDDRPQVIRECWKPLGIFVMDVGPGYDF